jgi:hypothetical protein
MPIIMRAQAPLKFMYEPGMLSIYMEHASDTRFIHEPETAHVAQSGLSGQLGGHWEGDTLVIESVGSPMTSRSSTARKKLQDAGAGRWLGTVVLPAAVRRTRSPGAADLEAHQVVEADRSLPISFGDLMAQICAWWSGCV